MEKIVEQGLLYDFYGELLTEHQRNIYEGVVFNDMSLSEIAEERDDIVVGKVNVDDNMELAQKFSVTSIPMLAVIKNGQVVRSEVGARPKAAILDMID